MKKFILLVALMIGCSVHAAAVYWGFDYDNPSTSLEGANAYTYIWAPSTTVASDFINAWSTSYVANGSTVFGGLTSSNLSLDVVEGWEIVKSSITTTLNENSLADLVIILEQDGDYYYTITQATVMSNTSSVPENNPILADSNWTEFTVGPVTPPVEPGTPGVPEPTALALLALGVAGVALRRRA